MSRRRPVQCKNRRRRVGTIGSSEQSRWAEGGVQEALSACPKCDAAHPPEGHSEIESSPIGGGFKDMIEKKRENGKVVVVEIDGGKRLKN